jgi:hypothetical protein
MEHAPLRPVPARPAGPIDPATALREVSSWLPTLSPVAARALALVVLAERPRSEVASALGLSEADLGALLAEARKELRQTIAGLGGSGWCERAEGLISDRLDGALAERDARRLDVHLRNCPRCVEHERRLVQATDALVLSAGGPSRPTGAETDVTPLAEAPAPSTETEAPPLVEAPETPDEKAAAEEAAPPVKHVPPAHDDTEEAAPDEAVAAEDQVAAAAEVLVAVRTRRQIAGAIVWNSLIALAILLVFATLALTIAGILGAQL